jgi:protein-tyrosine phosphatase
MSFGLKSSIICEMEKKQEISVLFVCTGNICRSPTAEAVFRQIVDKRAAGQNVTHDSAGTHGYHIGDPPDYRSVAVARSNGILMDDLRARKIDVTDFERFSHIVAMDKGHEDAINRMRPQGARAQVSLLLDHHADHKRKDVPDPYYGTLQDFEHTYSLILQGVEALCDEIL